MMKLTIVKFKRDKNKKLTSKLKESGKEVLVTECIEDLIEPHLKIKRVKEYYSNQSEDVNIEVLDVTKLSNLISLIDDRLLSLFESYKNSKELKKKNEILNEIESISSLNSLIRDYFFLSRKDTKGKDLFLYYT